VVVVMAAIVLPLLLPVMSSCDHVQRARCSVEF